MVLIEDYKRKYDYVKDSNSNYGYSYKYNKEESWIGYNILQATYDFHKFKKSRDEFNCATCEKKYPKKSRYIGSCYSKICIKCAEEWFKNSEISLNQIKDSLKHNAEILYKNKKEWEEDMVLNSL